jgi:hypothetical protein
VEFSSVRFARQNIRKPIVIFAGSHSKIPDDNLDANTDWRKYFRSFSFSRLTRLHEDRDKRAFIHISPSRSQTLPIQHGLVLWFTTASREDNQIVDGFNDR